MTTTPEKSVRDSYDLFVGGEFVPAKSGETLVTVNPATEGHLTDVAAGTEADIDVAVQDARDGFEEWNSMAPAERGRILNRLADRLREEKDRLGRIESLDNGKPLSEAVGNIEGCARYFEYYAGIADKIQGETVPLGEDYVDYTIREPYGVSGQIIPWNFPAALTGRGVAPALAAGNSVVAKPAEQTPLSALEIADLAVDAGLPPSVFNVVPGYGTEAGAALSNHPDVDVVTFTGSVPTGREVARSAVDNLNPVHLELGGKSPNVVYPDAPFEKAIEDTLVSVFTRTSGQVCSAGARLLVHQDVHDEFLDELVARTRDLTVGPGIDDPDVGPLVSEEQFEKVTGYLDIGKTEVGQPLVGGNALERDGYFVEPTIFDAVDHDTRLSQEEIFGPVLTVTTFANEDEAIELANDVPYGLVAGIFTDDVGRANRFAREVDAGQIFVNEWFAGGVETPFGGYKQSGFGREKGLEALHNYTQVKNVCARIDL